MQILYCEPKYFKETKKEYEVDGYGLKFVGTIDPEAGDENMLPADRALKAE